MPTPAPRPPHSRRPLILSLTLVFLLGLFVARLPTTLAQIGLSEPGNSGNPVLIADVRRLVINNFVDDITPEKQAKLTKGAIDGMLEALDDPYAEYVPAEDAADFEKAMTGSFSGIGCQIDIRDHWLYVVSPMEDSPAFNAGVLAGDRITKVDGKSTEGKTADQCIKMITGPEGTIVHIDVQRAGQDLTFDIKRARIVSKSARGFRRLSDDSGHWDYLIDPANKTAYIRLSQFTPTSPKELTDSLDKAQAAAGGEIKGLILDLRDNPGGLMDAAINIVDMFVDSGRIMSTKGRNAPEYVVNANPGTDKPKYPIAILVNGNSASASEIVSGSLSEHDRAIVIGSRTFGKGLVQSVQPLPHDQNAIVKFTTQHYYLPSGRLIQRTDEATVWGVDPTPGNFLPLTDEENLAYRLKRFSWDILRKPGTPLPKGVEEVPALADQHWSDPTWIESTAKDKQLAGALKTMQAKLTAGQWVALSDAQEQHGKIAATELKTLDKLQLRMGKEFARIEKRIETLNAVASGAKHDDKLQDLWPDDLDLTGGLIEVKDKDGKIIADLKITGRDIERWLAFADVENPNKESADATKKPTDHAKANPDDKATPAPKQ